MNASGIACLVALLLIKPLSPACAASPWVYSDDDDIPEDAIRITSLGSGTPNVHKEQVTHAGFLLALQGLH
jgi:hypothetical protein